MVAHAIRGMYVAPLVNSETEQSYALRLLVEPPTVGATIGSLRDSDVQDMWTHLESMRQHRGHSRRFQMAHQLFHDVVLDRYPSNFAELTRTLHTTIYRHQSVYLSHARTPDDFIECDQYFLDAIGRRNAASARRIMEFHLIDAALGLVLDADPDHCFDSLLVAMRGRDIVIAHDEQGRIERPAPIYWIDSDPVLPDFTTSNLALIAPPGRLS